MTPGHVHGVKNLAQAEAEGFSRRLALLAPIRKSDPYYLSAVWWDEMTRIYSAMRATERLDLLDNRLARDGLDIIQRHSPQRNDSWNLFVSDASKKRERPQRTPHLQHHLGTRV